MRCISREAIHRAAEQATEIERVVTLTSPRAAAEMRRDSGAVWLLAFLALMQMEVPE